MKYQELTKSQTLNDISSVAETVIDVTWCIKSNKNQEDFLCFYSFYSGIIFKFNKSTIEVNFLFKRFDSASFIFY